MKTWKKIGIGVMTLTLGLSLAACGSKGGDKKEGNKKDSYSAALVTDTGGVDDKSFNQSAWEGLQKWGKDAGLKKGVNGYNYYQSGSEADYKVNIDQAVNDGFKVVYGIGYLLKPSIEESAKDNPDTNFVIIDDAIEGLDNVASATFKDNESSYLAGVAAAKTTKTNKVGFVGGEQSEVIDRFEAGFYAGVKATNKDIEVYPVYAGSFSSPDKGKTATAGLFNKGVDIVFHASGGTGAGVFAEAKAKNELLDADSEDKVWVIGVDRDQHEEGNYTSKDGKKSNFTLTSTLKGVDTAVVDITTKAAKDKFPGGKHLNYGLKEDGVGLSKGNISEEAQKAVDSAKKEIVDGKVKVPETPTK